MTDKFELASEQWLQTLFGLLSEAAAQHPDAEFSVCEVFTDVPSRLNPDSEGRVAWHGKLANGSATCQLGEVPAEEVDLKAVGEWEALLPAARALVEMTPEGLLKYRALTEVATKEGRITRKGDPSKAPAGMMAVHNILAEKTI